MTDMQCEAYYEYYDKIFINKDYQAETEVVFELAQKIYGKKIERLLDIGCGTGSHSLLFAKKECQVVGIDIDERVVEKAQHKINTLSGRVPEFYCQDIRQLVASNFDLAVSLFNVVNYINRVEDLLTFFSAVQKRLRAEGVFIFDCWNGIAASLDVPQQKQTQVSYGEEMIQVSTLPYTDLMKQSVTVDNEVDILLNGQLQTHFSFKYCQKLWSPAIISNLLEMAGFNILKITAWMKPDILATHNTWKIMFLCQK